MKHRLHKLGHYVRGWTAYFGMRENFVGRADSLNRPLRTRTVGGVGAGG